MTDARTITRDLVGKARVALAGPFPNYENSRSDSGTATTDLHARSAPTLRAIFGAVDLALQSVQDATTAAASAHGQGFYTPEERQRRATEAINDGEAAYNAAHASATSLINEMIADCRRTGPPPRPGPVDATQEAALANLRSDLRMLLDPLQGAEVPDRLAELAHDAQANGDRLGVWFIAGSPWPAAYMRSRNLQSEAILFEHALATGGHGAVDGSEQTQARAGLAVLDDGPECLRNVVEVALPVVPHWELQAARDMRSVPQ